MILTILSILIAVAGILITVWFQKEGKDWLKKNLSVIFLPIKHRRFLKETEKLGIKKIYKTRTEAEMENPFFSLDISISLRTVKSMGISLARIKNLGDERIKCHLKQGCKFEFLLLNPDSPLMEQRAYQENPDLKGEAKGFTDWIEKTFSTSEYKAQIQVWTYDLMPTMAITIINDNLLFVNPYSILRRNQEFPVIEVREDGSLFRLYKDEYEKVLGHTGTNRIFP